jgi:DNA end-binding protein Ku
MAASVWKGHITFGLISIPIRLLRAARSERVPLRELYRAEPAAFADTDESDMPASEPSLARGPVRIDRKRKDPEPAITAEPVYEPVRRISVGQSSEERRSASDITKGYEFERGRYVTIAADELRAIAPTTSADMEIVEFVRLAEIDPVYFEASYYVKPEDPGRKPYALLYEAMREAQYAAITQFAMHRRDRIALLRPSASGLMAHTMYFASEVRSDQEVRADTSLLTPKEITLAKTLINALAAPFDPSKYRDKYREKLEALIAAKVEGKETAAVIAATPHAQPAVDIMEALRKSLESIKMPPLKAEAPRRRVSRRGGSK